jgi:hypothetical protein
MVNKTASNDICGAGAADLTPTQLEELDALVLESARNPHVVPLPSSGRIGLEDG